MREVRNALVLGGAGFLGTALVRALESEGVHVTVVDRRPQNDSRPVDVAGDLLDGLDLVSVLARSRPDVVYHLASAAFVPPSLEDPLGDLIANTGSTVVVLEAARRLDHPPLVVLASSAAVYGTAERIPMAEDHPCNPLSPYGASKLAAEAYLTLYSRLYRLPCVAARLFSLYGPGQRKQVIYDLLRRLYGGEDPLLIDADPSVTRDFLFVDDAARLLMALARRCDGSGDAYNLATGHPVRLDDLVEQLIMASGVPVRTEFTGTVRAGDPMRWEADVEKMASLTAQAATPLAQGLEITAAWVREDMERELGDASRGAALGRSAGHRAERGAATTGGEHMGSTSGSTLDLNRGGTMNDSLVLITGGAGFIGSHLVDRLVADGREVRVLDSLEDQVHGDGWVHRNPKAEYIEGTILDALTVDDAVRDVGAVVHLAAQVGVGQSMYEMSRYVRENSLGTTMLLEALARRSPLPETLVVASSMSIYGEGRYDCRDCAVDDAPVHRSKAQLAAGDWQPRCRLCGKPARARPTPETKRLECDSVYAVTKRDHEDLCLIFGRAYGVRTVALRFFNVYGPRQSLSNPYTGVAAIFSSRLLNGARPLVFEDGCQSRDFVHVSDVVAGIDMALSTPSVGDSALNIGTGASTTVRDVAETLAAELALDVEPEIVARFRHGDVRHCYADISAARAALGYEPVVDFASGMRELVTWIKQEMPPAADRVALATGQLETRGLLL